MSGPPIDIQALAALAGIHLPPEEASPLEVSLQAMLHLADSLPLGEVPADTLEAWVAASLPPTPRRGDSPRCPRAEPATSPLIEGAPVARGPFFALPRLIDP